MLCLLSSPLIYEIYFSYISYIYAFSIHFFRVIVHGASGLTYKIKQEPQAHTLEPQQEYNMTSNTNPFDTLFADKDLQATERSLRAHKGVLTKLTCYIDTAVNAVKVLPTVKGCIELEQLKDGMEDRRDGGGLR